MSTLVPCPASRDRDHPMALGRHDGKSRGGFANTAIRSHAYCSVERPDLVGGEVPAPTRLEGPQLDRPELGSDQRMHAMTHRLEQPPHDVVASLVDDQLDQHPGAVDVLDLEVVHPNSAVFELDPRPQPPPKISRHGSGDFSQV